MKLGFSFSSKVVFKGRAFKINAGFGNVIRAAELLKDGGVSERARIDAALRLLLKPAAFSRSRLLCLEQRAALLGEVFTALNPKANSNAKAASVNSKHILSVTKDGGLIYGAFLQAYGIDLEKKDKRLDWRIFCALLSCVPENTALFSVMKNRMENTEITEDLNEGLETLYKNLSIG